MAIEIKKEVVGEVVGGVVNAHVATHNTSARVEVDKEVLDKLLATVQELKDKDVENQEKLELLYGVADKGRLMNAESQRAGGQKSMKVKLSVFADGIITGWRTVKDELVKHPTTGLLVGEVQEYELVVLGNDGDIKKITVNGYPQFSDARYNERVEAEVVSKKEDFKGNMTFDVKLSNGKVIELDSRFVN